MTGEEIAGCISRCRFNYANEAGLQDGVEALFQYIDVPYIREARLSDSDRIDFLIGSIGVEVKVASSMPTVRRQLARYARCSEISELVLITDKRKHDFPDEIEGKGLYTVWLSLQGL